MSTIVVGVDGSQGSRLALRWALEEARLRGSRLRAVHAWLYPRLGGHGYVPAELLDPEVLQRGAQTLLDATVAGVAGARPRVEIERVVAEGPAADVLLAAAADADLLVVGSRGRGALTGLVLGSVSAQCAHRSPCPVVIAAPHRPAGASGA